MSSIVMKHIMASSNETRPEVYEPESARTAWERTLKFLNNALA